MKKTRNAFLTFVAILLAPMAANADVIYDNGSSTNLRGWCSDCASAGWILFDDFAILDDVTITGIDWDASVQSGNPLQDVTISIWTGVNTGQLFTQTFLSSALSAVLNDTSGGFDNYMFSTALSSFDLSAGSYYLSIYGSANMHFSEASGNAIQFHPSGCPDGCQRTGFLPFRLQGELQTVTVPEPGTLALVGIALFGMSLVRRKSKA